MAAADLASGASRYTFLSMFSGAGGLDIGFARRGFHHLESVDIDPWCVRTLRLNRPKWHVVRGDARSYEPPSGSSPDVLLAGFPCQGFSLGGNRDEADERNTLYQEVVRVARAARPRAVVIENVLNLRTMRVPGTGRPFADQIAGAMRAIGYTVFYNVFKMCHYGAPQTRRRYVFLAFRDRPPDCYHLPPPGPLTVIRPFLYDLAQGGGYGLPNHDPQWGFRSSVHAETGEPFDDSEEVVPVRFSRTASDGHPVRSFDAPFPAVDTATVWGWAQGNVRVARVQKDRESGKHIRNPDATVTLWRVSASRLRSFTHREYARLQTFPDDWQFVGGNKRDIHLQIGNAVPVRFAEVLADHVHETLDAMDDGIPMPQLNVSHNLALF